MAQATKLEVRRLFTKPKSKAYDALKWLKRDSLISNPGTGKAVFDQKGVDFPEGWSLNAINIVAQKYFTGTPGTGGRESSLKQLIDRVVDTVARQGIDEGYFDSKAEADDFREELKYILATQRASFNSPVWFNIGVPERAQQASEMAPVRCRRHQRRSHLACQRGARRFVTRRAGRTEVALELLPHELRQRDRERE